MREVYPNYGFGMRIDGTFKGPGFSWAPLPGGGLLTEVSAGTPDQLYPLVYEGISPVEMMTLADLMSYGWADPMVMDRIAGNAYNAMLDRAMQGKPAFWSPMYDEPLGYPVGPIEGFQE